MIRNKNAIAGSVSLCQWLKSDNPAHLQGLLMKIDAFHYIQPGTVYRWELNTARGNKSEMLKKKASLHYNFKFMTTIKNKTFYKKRKISCNALLSSGDWNHCRMRRCSSSTGGRSTSPCSRTVASMERWAGLHDCAGGCVSFKLPFCDRWEQHSCMSGLISSLSSL